jgi:hypothetical protein
MEGSTILVVDNLNLESARSYAFCWLRELSGSLGRLGFDWIWLLSVWQTGENGRRTSRENEEWRREFTRNSSRPSGGKHRRFRIRDHRDGSSYCRRPPSIRFLDDGFGDLVGKEVHFPGLVSTAGERSEISR